MSLKVIIVHSIQLLYVTANNRICEQFQKTKVVHAGKNHRCKILNKTTENNYYLKARRKYFPKSIKGDTVSHMDAALAEILQEKYLQLESSALPWLSLVKLMPARITLIKIGIHCQ